MAEAVGEASLWMLGKNLSYGLGRESEFQRFEFLLGIVRNNTVEVRSLIRILEESFEWFLVFGGER